LLNLIISSALPPSHATRSRAILQIAFRCSSLPTIYCVPDAVLGVRAVRWKQARHKMHDPGVAHHVVCRLVYDPLIDLEFVVRHCAPPSFQRLPAIARFYQLLRGSKINEAGVWT
jgi:hypothetical protein